MNWLGDVSPIETIPVGRSAWSLAGKAYNRKTTIYFLPSGRIKYGSKISNWDLPVRTKIIIGYRGPFRIQKDRSTYHIAGVKFRDRKTIYYLPSQKLLGGNNVKISANCQAAPQSFFRYLNLISPDCRIYIVVEGCPKYYFPLRMWARYNHTEDFLDFRKQLPHPLFLIKPYA